ncbi:MAG: hypothetical protein ACLFN8_02395 [Candidatus Woesearchaeota archaeon]
MVRDDVLIQFSKSIKEYNCLLSKINCFEGESRSFELFNKNSSYNVNKNILSTLKSCFFEEFNSHYLSSVIGVSFRGEINSLFFSGVVPSSKGFNYSVSFSGCRGDSVLFSKLSSGIIKQSVEDLVVFEEDKFVIEGMFKYL